MGKYWGTVRGSPDGVQVKRDGLLKSQAIHSRRLFREAVCSETTPGLGTTQSIPTAAATFGAYYPEDPQQGWDGCLGSSAFQITSVSDCLRLGLSAPQIVRASECQDCQHPRLSASWIIRISDCRCLGSSVLQFVRLRLSASRIDNILDVLRKLDRAKVLSATRSAQLGMLVFRVASVLNRQHPELSASRIVCISNHRHSGLSTSWMSYATDASPPGR